MDHHEAPRDGGRARRTSLRAGRGRVAVGPSNARVADAAKAAADGLRGVQGIDGPRTGRSARAPGVGVLFGPMPSMSAPPTGERVGASPPADVGVWNPFRQQRPDPRRPAARPEIGNLHTRHTATGVNVIATLLHRGRMYHGTAAGSATRQGHLRAVAEATVAALQIVADEPLRVGVDQVRWVDDDPARVEIVVTWATGSGDEAVIGTATAHDGADGAAAMQATLDALSPHVEQPVGATPQR